MLKTGYFYCCECLDCFKAPKYEIFDLLSSTLKWGLGKKNFATAILIFRSVLRIRDIYHWSWSRISNNCYGNIQLQGFFLVFKAWFLIQTTKCFVLFSFATYHSGTWRLRSTAGARAGITNPWAPATPRSEGTHHIHHTPFFDLGYRRIITFL